MSSSRCHRSLGALLLLLGGNLAVLINVHKELVTGTWGQSALLPVSYGFGGAPQFPVTIRWMFPNSSYTLITCTVFNCSLGAGGALSNCSAKFFPHSVYGGRAALFPENGSLLLRDLRLSDSGVYVVTFREPFQTRNITLTVQEPRPTPQHPADTPAPVHIWVIGVCSSVCLLLLLLLFCCVWHRGAAQRKKRRIIKQQQVSNGEESHMESAMVRDMTTIYSRIGESFELPQPRPTPEAVYTTITSPGPPGLDAGLYHLPV